MANTFVAAATETSLIPACTHTAPANSYAFFELPVKSRQTWAFLVTPRRSHNRKNASWNETPCAAELFAGCFWRIACPPSWNFIRWKPRRQFRHERTDKSANKVPWTRKRSVTLFVTDDWDRKSFVRLRLDSVYNNSNEISNCLIYIYGSVEFM